MTLHWVQWCLRSDLFPFLKTEAVMVNIKDLILAELNSLFSLDYIVSDLQHTVFVIDMPICHHEQAWLESSNEVFIQEGSFINDFLSD